MATRIYTTYRAQQVRSPYPLIGQSSPPVAASEPVYPQPTPGRRYTSDARLSYMDGYERDRVLRIRAYERSGVLCQGKPEANDWNDQGCCSTKGTERCTPAGISLGYWCMLHFRRAHPEIALPKSKLGEIALLTPLGTMTVAGRRSLVYRLKHGEHLTLVEIGARLGVSSVRARQILHEAERCVKRAHMIAAAGAAIVDSLEPTICLNWVGEGVPGQ